MRLEDLPNVIEWRKMPPPPGADYILLLHKIVEDGQEKLYIRWQSKMVERYYSGCFIAWADMPTKNLNELLDEERLEARAGSEFEDWRREAGA